MKNLLSLSILTTSSLLAVSPNIDAIQNSISVPKIIEDKKQENKNELIEISGKKSYEPMLVDDKSGKKLLIKDYTFDGNSHVSSEELSSLINEYKNKELNFAELQNIASIITKEYRNRGYFVARAYIPKQKLEENNNILKFSIIEGNYGEIKVENNSNVKDFVVQSMLDDAKSKDNVVLADTLERSMLIVNDTPGIIVSQADVKPGIEVGSSDFLIKTEKTSFYDGYVVSDNYGSKYTGKNRIMSGINLNSPLQIGDKFSVSGLLSNGNDIENYKMGYSFPLMGNGLRGETNYSKTNYDLVNLGQTTPDGIYDGYTVNVEAGISYPIIRTKMENLNLSMIYSNKELKDYYDNEISKDRETNSVKVGLDYTKKHTLLGFDSASKIETFYTLGDLDIKDEISKQSDKEGVNTQGSYSKININVGNELQFTQIYSLNTNIKTQYAFKQKNLDGSEDFTLGGSEGVKVFNDSEQSVENAILFNAELIAQLPDISNLNHKIGMFYDIGTGTMSDNSKDVEFEKRTLKDLGVGYYINYKSSFAKIQAARVVGNENIESENVGSNSRILAQAGFVF
jgi:hemolysin activation/secretion protein